MIREYAPQLTIRERWAIAETILGVSAAAASLEVSDTATATSFGLVIGGSIVVADSLRRLLAPVYHGIFHQEQPGPSPTDEL